MEICLGFEDNRKYQVSQQSKLKLFENILVNICINLQRVIFRLDLNTDRYFSRQKSKSIFIKFVSAVTIMLCIKNVYHYFFQKSF